MSTILPLRPVTPGALKVLMALESLAILILGSWLYVEYQYSSTFRNLLGDLIFSRIAMWTAVIGVSAGLGGSAAAIGMWRRLRLVRHRVETLERDLIERTHERPP